jgi:hypothetical protein
MGAVESLHRTSHAGAKDVRLLQYAKARCSRRGSETGLTVCQKSRKTGYARKTQLQINRVTG